MQSPGSGSAELCTSVQTHCLSFTYPGIGKQTRALSCRIAASESNSSFHRQLLLPTDGRPLAGMAPVVSDLTLSVPRGSSCLLIGPNGAGKTTFLKILGGKHMVPETAVRVLGQPPFHATSLTADGRLAYLGGNWERDIAFAGYSVPLQVPLFAPPKLKCCCGMTQHYMLVTAKLSQHISIRMNCFTKHTLLTQLQGDFPASKMLNGFPGVDPVRRAKLMEVLDINPDWRMHTVSDGQRRRVQICLGLLKPFDVLLLDEITVDLDVLGRADLMQFLKEECEQRGATIIYVGCLSRCIPHQS